jgi:L-histidine Nalpha-methyltransferase / hercynylcysteine S-oxide synthase
MLFNIYEHIALHMETLLYMLAQSHKTQPPAGFLTPDWATLARNWDAYDQAQSGEEARNARIAFKSANVTIGHMDDETEDFGYKIQRATDDIRSINEQLGSPEFGWDIESPARKIHVPAFHITAAPITNEQYAEYMKATGLKEVPASWVGVGTSTPDKPTDYYVRTVYGPVSMQVARLWPLQASGNELQDYAKWKGGRLPTQGELRRFLDAAHGPNCTDRPGTNVGFRNWHPVPSQLAKKDMDGTILPAHNGGVWEWTSTPLASFEGYKPSDLYPGYSSDFFDGNHWIVLGGSWATIPSIAGRRSCVNWYQVSTCHFCNPRQPFLHLALIFYRLSTLTCSQARASFTTRDAIPRSVIPKGANQARQLHMDSTERKKITISLAHR